MAGKSNRPKWWESPPEDLVITGVYLSPLPGLDHAPVVSPPAEDNSASDWWKQTAAEEV